MTGARLLSAIRASATAFSETVRAEAPLVTSRRFWIGLVILLLSLAVLVARPWYFRTVISLSGLS